MGFVIGQYFDSVPFALCILDRAGHILFVNAQMAGIVDRPIAELDGFRITALFPEFARLLERCYGLAEIGQPIPDLRVTWRGRAYVLTFSVTFDSSGKLAEMLIGAADITREARLETRLRQSRRQLLASLRIDHLTELLNRRGLEAAIVRELRRSQRKQSPVSLLIVDIDCFKAYNDRFGHVEGDRCLMNIAGAIGKYGRRAGDAVGRFGGEEFVVVLPNTDEEGALKVAENCRSTIEALGIDHPGSPSGRVTVSIGVTVVRGVRGMKIDTDRVARCIAAADDALYEAKRAGRNRTRFHALPGG